MPPPPKNPVSLTHSCDKLKQRVKQIRKRKGEYRKKIKKRAIDTRIKKKNKTIKNALNTPTDGDDIDLSQTPNDDDDDVIYVKYVLPTPKNPVALIHPRDKFKPKVKKIRTRKEEYRKRAKKRAIDTLIKKKNKSIKNTLLKFPIENIENNTPIDNVDGDDIDFEITSQTPDNEDDDAIYVNYVPPPPKNPVPFIHPRDRLKQKLKQIRKRKEKYRINTKKKGIRYLNKKKADMLSKDHIKKQSYNLPASPDTNAELYMIINKNTLYKKDET